MARLSSLVMRDPETGELAVSREVPAGVHDDRIFAAALNEYLRQSKPPRRPDGRLFPPQHRVLRASFDTGEGPDRPRRFVHNREDRSRDGEDR